MGQISAKHFFSKQLIFLKRNAVQGWSCYEMRGDAQPSAVGDNIQQEADYMPILIKDYHWRQTDDLVVVRVPLQNIPHTKVDLFTSDFYIKVHFPPYLFESCLYDTVKEEESKCTLVHGEAVFELVKSEKKEWPSLNKDISKQEMMEIKKQAIDSAHNKASEKSKKRKEEKTKRRRECCGEQVALDGEIYNTIQNKKLVAKGEAVSEIMEWKKKETDQDFLPTPIQKAEAALKSVRVGKSHVIKGSSNKVESTKHKKDIFSDEDVKRDCLTKEYITPDKKKEDDIDKFPPPRTCSRIGVNFTFRAFPTPSRESHLQEEQEWLKKQAEARRRTGFVAEDLRPEENDPQWLLQKGKSFHEVGNYLGAISAFTHALQTWTKIPELWVARSESQLQVGNFRRVLRDTSEAIELLKPHVASNADLRFISHLNRGKALIEIGRPDAALADFEEALMIRPYREDIHNLMDRAESLIQAAKEQPEPTNEDSTPKYIEPEDLAN